MSSVNKAILLGFVGKDPETKSLPSGDSIANFSLATSESWKDRSGAKQEKTEWFNVEVFGKLAEIVRDYVGKGSQLYIEGQIVTDEWLDKEGVKKTRTKIKLSGPNCKLVMLGGKGKGKTQDAGSPDSDDPSVPF